ncbi:MAG: secretin N-terminal domain-containing protein [Candidatus Omnitrophota bacterium]
MKKKLLLLFLPVFLGSALVWNAGGLHSEEVGSAESMLPRIPRGDTAISVDFKEASLKDILKILSQQTGLSFVPSQDVEDKKLTIFFENVPVQNVIDSIVQANALSYEKGPDKNIFIVRPSGAEKIKTITKIYTLNFVQVSSMGSGSPGGSENSAMAGGGYNPEGASGQGGAGDGGIKGIISKVLSPVGNVVTDQRTNSLIITDIPERFTLIEEMIITLDTPTLQVFIEAEIIETSLQVAERLGLEYGGSSGQWAATYSGPSREYGFPYRTKIFKDQGSSPSYSLGSLQFGDISLLLKALTSNAKTKYLARPRILTLNNETATIEITSDSAIGSVTTSGESSGTSTTSPERQQTGVSLKVTPQINSAGFITMLIEPRCQGCRHPRCPRQCWTR